MEQYSLKDSGHAGGIFPLENTSTWVTSTRQEVRGIAPGSTLMNGLVKNWRVLNEPPVSDHRINKLDIESNSEIKGIGEGKEKEKGLGFLYKISEK